MRCLCGCIGTQPSDANAGCHILVIGLEGSGKTLLLRRLQAISSSKPAKAAAAMKLDTMATIGTELQRLVLPKGAASRAVIAREVGGAMQPLWPQYFSEADAVLFVVDASNASSIAPAALELWALLDDSKLYGKPVCVALNKSDAPHTLSRCQLDALLRLPDLGKLHGSRLSVVQGSAKAGDGVQDVLGWVAVASAATMAGKAVHAGGTPGQRASSRSGNAWGRVTPL